MDPLTMMAIMGALGVAKSELIDRPKEKRQRKLASETEAFSPWTGKSAGAIQEADPFGQALQFGATGASMGSNLQKSKLDGAMADRLNSGGSMIYSGKNFMQEEDPSLNPWGLGVDYRFRNS